MGLVGVHHVSLSVSDLDRSIEWYAATLGFEVLFREEGEGRRACVMRFADGGYSVGLVEHASATDGEPLMYFRGKYLRGEPA